MPTTNTPSNNSTAWRLACIVVILVWMPGATVSAQSSKAPFETAYERALLDSTLILQALRPVHNSLKKAHEALRIETQALRQETIMLRMQARIERETHQRILQGMEKRRKRQRWLDRAGGFALGLLF